MCTYRHPVELFDLDEEDFEPQRPAPLSLKELALLETDPPNWALRAIHKIGGHHQMDCKEVRSPSGIVLAQTIGPAWPPSMATKEDVDGYDSWLKRRDKKAQKALVHSKKLAPKNNVPPGNLQNDDYRYWKGFPLHEYEKNVGTCKWCYKTIRGLTNMREHFRAGYCRERLTALYRYARTMSQQRYCFACKAQTGEDSWGVPLCNKVECIARWKFQTIRLLQGYVQYREWAEDAHFQDPKNGPFGDLPDDIVSGVPC